MKILCDVHIARKVANFYQSKGIEAIHVNDTLHGDTSKDSQICSFADKGGYSVVTKDQDFQDSFFLKNTPERLLKIELGNISTNRLIEILEKHHDTIIDFFELPGMVVLGKNAINLYRN
jgi:predicted nuclease of predicted toxin-antitoxin system